MRVEPYLHFDGRCAEAVAYYQQALDAEVEMLMRYRESPEPLPPGIDPAVFGERVMHACLRIGDSRVMAADACGDTPAGFAGFQLSLTVADRAEAERRFAALADGGEVRMALAETFFSPCFGMLADRFGVGWMLIVLPPPVA